jgi:rhodanese-related sulfurtransferase
LKRLPGKRARAWRQRPTICRCSGERAWWKPQKPACTSRISLADAQVGQFLLDLRRLAESRLAEIQHVTRQYLEGRGALEPIDDEELLRRVRAGDVTVVDVRPREEYVAGHLPGAISVPLADLPGRVREFRKRRDIVAYCRGPYCVMALDAVDLLRRKGFRAHRLEHGVAEWRARGWRVEAGTDVGTSGRP